MKALVTGCAGFIGSHITDRLLQDGYEVTGIGLLQGLLCTGDKGREPAFSLHIS